MVGEARRFDDPDVVIVGMGGSGGTVAKVLSEAGLSVVGLERGPWLRPAEHFSGDELKYMNRNYLWPDLRVTPRTLRHDENSTAEPFPFSMMPNVVGGGTAHWGGWLPRPRESDFIQKTLHGAIEG
jgi:choline dehydrogenase-like flavoprotein